MGDISVNGYVVIQPLSPWDKPHRAEIIGHMSRGSFGLTPVEAWLCWTGATQHDMDQTMRVQRLVERGYYLAEATLTIHEREWE